MVPDGDVLAPVLHRLVARDGPTAAGWCRAPGARSDVRATLTATRLAVETAEGAFGHVRVSPRALPLRTRSVDRIAVPLVLPLLADMDGLFTELRRVLAPHGLLSLLLPAPRSFGLRGRWLTRSVRESWRHRSAVEHPEWLASSADFAVLADDRIDFRLADGGDPAHEVAQLCAAGVYPPELPDDARGAVVAHLAGGRAVRLRRIVARR